MPDSNKLRFKYLSHRSLHEGPPNVFQDPGLPLMKLGIRVFQAKFGRNLGLKVSVGDGIARNFGSGLPG